MHLRHRWEYVIRGVDQGSEVCHGCGKVRDLDRAKRSRSSVRLGKDVERRLAKRFGWVKVGQFGDAVDLIGDTVKVQSKATRDPAPGYFPGYGIVPVEPHKWITEPLGKMERLYPSKMPVLAMSYVAKGVPTATWLVVQSDRWDAEYGKTWSPPNPAGLPFYVMSGDYWLDVAGLNT